VSRHLSRPEFFKATWSHYAWRNYLSSLAPHPRSHLNVCSSSYLHQTPQIEEENNDSNSQRSNKMPWDGNNLFYPTHPRIWHRLPRNPVLFLVRWLYTHQPPIEGPLLPPHATPIKVVCLSDTHNETPEVPDGDILIHAGDLTQNGTFAELQAQLSWLAKLPHQHKIVIAGNHDLLLDATFSVKNGPSHGIEPGTHHTKDELSWGDIIYLSSEFTTLRIRERTLKVFGCPLTHKYGNWAFQHPPTKDIWANIIPSGTDIVVTHGPAKGHLDNDAAGCPHLIRELWRVKPRLAVWGHMHHGRGKETVLWDAVQNMYDTAVGTKAGGIAVFEFGVLVWIWRWLMWLVFGWKMMGRGVFVNAAIVGHWGVEVGTVVEI